MFLICHGTNKTNCGRKFVSNFNKIISPVLPEHVRCLMLLFPLFRPRSFCITRLKTDLIIPKETILPGIRSLNIYHKLYHRYTIPKHVSLIINPGYTIPKQSSLIISQVSVHKHLSLIISLV